MVPVSLYIFTEEESARTVLNILLPHILPAEATFQIFSHQGKQDLEKSLPKTLPAISRIPNARILILEDQDSNDCLSLKAKLKAIADVNCTAPYKIRIVCKCLENWFLGDLKAVAQTFPRFKAEKHAHKASFRHIDAIGNAPGELLQIVPELRGKSRLPKMETAKRIAAHLNIENNQSGSFNQTIAAIRKLVGMETETPI